MRTAGCRALAIIVLAMMPSIAAGDVRFGEVQVHKGTCEPSAAIAVSEGSLATFIVANDEDNVLRAYRSTGGEPVKVKGGKLDKFLRLDPEEDDDDKADFEGAAWLDGKVYWIGSHSRSGKGKVRKQRWQFFATRVSGRPGRPVVERTARRAFNDLLPAIAALDARLNDKIRLDLDPDETLKPDAGGFNIEGLTARADGKSLLIGLRSPLIDGDAVLIPLANPKGVAEKGKEPKLASPLRVDLGGRGIRSIEYSAAAKTYFIVAGPSDGKSGTFDLLRWPADETGPAVPVPGFAEALARLDRFQPEALVVDASGKKLHLFSDDGDLCKERKTPPEFRSVTVTLE
jgi:hypothetical protein